MGGRIGRQPGAARWKAGSAGCGRRTRFSTRSDFRAGNREALDSLCIGVLGILRAENLLTVERVVHDGTKVRACAGVDTFRSEDRLAVCLEEAREHVQALAAEENDPELSARRRRARERAARERLERLERAVSELQDLQQAASTRRSSPKPSSTIRRRTATPAPQGRPCTTK